MSTPSRVILLCCGSFNPITNMHLRMFEIARDALHKSGQWKVIGGIISPVSDGYGKKELVSAKYRCAMVQKALKNNDWIKMDSWESEQETWSETLKVLRHQRQKLDAKYNSNSLNESPAKKRKMGRNNSPDDLDNLNLRNLNEMGPVQLKLLCGADLLESFATPGLWKTEDMEEIVSHHGLVVITRAGSNPEQFIYENDMLYKNQNNILLVTEWINNEISSTKIRRALRRGDSVKYLLQDSVIDYIQDNQLYGAGDNCLVPHQKSLGNRPSQRRSTGRGKRRKQTDAPHYKKYDMKCCLYIVTRVPVCIAHKIRHHSKLTHYNIITPSPNNDDVDGDIPSSPTPSPSLEGNIRYLSPQHYHSDDAILQDYTGSGIRRYRRMHNRNFHSDDSDDSMERSPPLPRRPITCMGADISGLMRRVKNMRVAVTPETCV